MATHLDLLEIFRFKHEIEFDTDFKEIRKVFRDYFLSQNRNSIPDICTFNEIRPCSLNKLNFYLIKYDISYSHLAHKVLGYTQIAYHSKYYNEKEVLYTLFNYLKNQYGVGTMILEADLNKNNPPRHILSTIRSAKKIWGVSFTELTEQLGFNHPITEKRVGILSLSDCNWEQHFESKITPQIEAIGSNITQIKDFLSRRNKQELDILLRKYFSKNTTSTVTDKTIENLLISIIEETKKEA